MADIGTYGSSSFASFPFKVLPEPADIITYDWMDNISQFQMRYMRMATTIATVFSGENVVFDYSALRCDFFPPYIKVYIFNPEDEGTRAPFSIYNPYSDPQSPSTGKFWRVQEIGLGSCKLVNQLLRKRVFLIQAYL